MQELEIMVDVLPWAPDPPPCSSGVVDDVLQHVHGALPEDALDMSADLACGFDATAGEVPAGEVPAGEVPAGEVPAGEVPAGEVRRMVDDSGKVPEPSSRWTRRSSGAATSSNGQQKRELRGVGCAPRERPESGPGSSWRLSETVLSSAPGIGAPTGSSVGFEARGSAPMASSSGLCRRGRPWRGDARAPESADMPLACIGWASAMTHSKPSTKDTKQPATNHRSTLDGGSQAQGLRRAEGRGWGLGQIR